MRTLLPLPLEGCHTRDVEALPSYLCRLASVHGVTVGGLLRHLGRGTEQEPAVLAAAGSQALATFVRPNSTTLLIVGLIARSRSEDVYALQRSTFQFLNPSLSRTSNGFSASLRWCPGCLRKQLLDVGNAYLKLVWFFADVSACGEHRLMLRESCPHCGKKPNYGRGWTAIETCPHCHGRLDKITDRDTTTCDVVAAAADLHDLVGEIAVASEPFPAGAANEYLAQLLEEAWRGEREDELWKKIPRDDCIRYAHGDEPISLTAARRLAYQLEQPIADLLRGGVGSSGSFNFASTCPLPQALRAAHRDGSINAHLLAKQLKVYLADTAEPPSLRQIGKRLGVSVGAMRYHAPSVVRRLAKRREEFIRIGRQKTNEAVLQAVQQGIRRWSSLHDRPVGKKPLLRALMRETGLPKEKLRRAINDAL